VLPSPLYLCPINNSFQNHLNHTSAFTAIMGEPWATFWLIFFIIGAIYNILLMFRNYFSYHDHLSIYPGPFLWK
jgi:hypothetical protein